jgi:hypothetical protein
MADVNLGYPNDSFVLTIIHLAASADPTIFIVSGVLLGEPRPSKFLLQEPLL